MAKPFDPGPTPDPGALDATMAEMDALLAATYQARDPGGLVTAVVDGEGRVERIDFIRTIARYHPDDVGDAVVAAVAAAQRLAGDALTELAVRTGALPADETGGTP